MDNMSRAQERAEMLVGLEIDEEQEAAAEETSSSYYYDDFNRDCSLSTKQVISRFPLFALARVFQLLQDFVADRPDIGFS